MIRAEVNYRTVNQSMGQRKSRTEQKQAKFDAALRKWAEALPPVDPQEIEEIKEDSEVWPQEGAEGWVVVCYGKQWVGKENGLNLFAQKYEAAFGGKLKEVWAWGNFHLMWEKISAISVVVAAFRDRESAESEAKRLSTIIVEKKEPEQRDYNPDYGWMDRDRPW